LLLTFFYRMSKNPRAEIRELRDKLEKLRAEINNLQTSINQLRGRPEDTLKIAAESKKTRHSKNKF